MVDVDIDCSQSENDWFEVNKAYLTNGGNFFFSPIQILYNSSITYLIEY